MNKTPFNKGDKVVARVNSMRGDNQEHTIQQGTTGKVLACLATTALIEWHIEPQYEGDWKRSSHWTHELERAP